MLDAVGPVTVLHERPNSIAEVPACPVDVFKVIAMVGDAADDSRRGPANAAAAVRSVVQPLPVLGEVGAVLKPVALVGERFENEMLGQN